MLGKISKRKRKVKKTINLDKEIIIEDEIINAEIPEQVILEDDDIEVIVRKKIKRKL